MTLKLLIATLAATLALVPSHGYASSGAHHGWHHVHHGKHHGHHGGKHVRKPHGTRKDSGNMDTGKAVIGCIASAAASTMFAAVRQGLSDDPRDLTVKEAAIAAGWGCTPFFIVALTTPSDNEATYEVARQSARWRNSPEGRDHLAMCRRGPDDACPDNGYKRFAAAMGEAYRNGEASAPLVRKY